MLTGKELGGAIAAAIKMKAVTKAEVAREFGVKPPSVSDWCKRGTIDKAKLPALFGYFADVVGPEHWGLADSPFSVREPGAPIYNHNIKPIPTHEDPLISQVVSIMRATDQAGRQMALAAVRVALHGHKPAKQNRAS